MMSFIAKAFDTKGVVVVVVAIMMFLFATIGADISDAGSAQNDVITAVNLTVCGDSIISPPEICDDGLANGTYSATILGRFCNDFDCQDWAAYCGDSIVQPFYGEECDDGDNDDNDGCSSICEQEQPLGGGGGGGGLGPFKPGSPIDSNDTSVIVKGKAYPNTDVNILQDGAVVGVVEADASADFFFETLDVTPGITTFSFWAEDVNQLQSVSLSMTFRIAENATTTVSGAYLPPTIGLEKNVVEQGELLPVFGQTIPGADVKIRLNQDEDNLTTTDSDFIGAWNTTLDTSALQNEEFNTAGAFFEITDPDSGEFIQSSYGRFVSFFVGLGQGDEDNCQRSDINNDSKVNLVDFSILLFNWGSSAANSDINGDGAVNLIDFSIMLFCWTG